MSDLTYIESLNKKRNFRKAEWCNWWLEGTKGREKGGLVVEGAKFVIRWSCPANSMHRLKSLLELFSHSVENRLYQFSHRHKRTLSGGGYATWHT